MAGGTMFHHATSNPISICGRAFVQSIVDENTEKQN